MTSVPEREKIMALVAAAIVSGARQERACNAISLSERTLQRWQADQARIGDLRPVRVQEPKNKLTTIERQRILSVANSDEFGHLAPSQIVPRLADQGQFVGSESSFYRVLKDANQLQHRRASKPSNPRRKPRALSATAPAQIYCWDITYLPSCVQGLYFYLYLFVDLYSRKIVGWQVYDVESSALASELIRDICAHENIAPGQVTLHSDNGSPMKGFTMRAMLEQLGVMQSLSRPSVSNDNPFSESLFKTLKYQSSYPNRAFEDLAAARAWVNTFVSWYNFEHRHSGIKFVTPAQRHDGADTSLLENRVKVYEAARARNPERWSGQTRNWQPILVVHLNPEKTLRPEINQTLETHPSIKIAA
jgi:transposase InsO family protein